MIGRNLVTVARPTLLCLGSAVALTVSAADIDPAADEALRAMSSYLGGLPSYSMQADIDVEIIDLQGQKLQFSSSAEMAVERPDKLHVRRRGGIAEVELTFNGQTLSLWEKRRNAYIQIAAPGTLDNAIDTLHLDTGLDTPGMDILMSDPYAILSSELTSGEYVGTAYVNDIECHHLAFRKDQVDWQLWVKTGDQPLPMKYVITTKWLTAAPQYSVRFRDWNVQPEIDPSRFAFSAPAEAVELETLSVNVLGELTMGDEQ